MVEAARARRAAHRTTRPFERPPAPARRDEKNLAEQIADEERYEKQATAKSRGKRDETSGELKHDDHDDLAGCHLSVHVQQHRAVTRGEHLGRENRNEADAQTADRRPDAHRKRSLLNNRSTTAELGMTKIPIPLAIAPIAGARGISENSSLRKSPRILVAARFDWLLSMMCPSRANSGQCAFSGWVAAIEISRSRAVRDPYANTRKFYGKIYGNWRLIGGGATEHVRLLNFSSMLDEKLCTKK